MSTQTRNSGGGGGSRNQKKTHIGSAGGGGSSGGGGDSSVTHISHKKTDTKTEKQEKSHPTPTAEQLRIAQIIETNKSEDPHMREKVATLIEMTQRSEEEVCCALNECDNNLERAVVFLLETLPVGAFERSSKKKKNKTVNVTQDSLGDGGDWTDNNANVDKREKSRNRSNRSGRGGTDSRGWRGREARENERNSRGLDRDDRANDNYRGGQRGGGRGGRGSNYAGRRGGGRVGGGRGIGSRTDRADYNSRYNSNDDHQEVELWDNTIAQNAEKQQQHSQDDTWGDWDNEEYVGSLKNSKVFTTSNLPNQTAASVLSSGLTNNGGVGVAGNSATNELTAPPGLEHHLGTSVIGSTVGTTIQSPGSHLNALLSNAVGTAQKLAEENSNSMASNVGLQSPANTPSLLQYSAAVSNSPSQLHQQQQIQGVMVGSTSRGSPTNLMVSNTVPYGSATNAQFSSTVDSFTNAANAAASLVQQVQQQQKQQKQQQKQQPQLTSQLKASATLSAEQSQYFNSLTSQNAAAAAAATVQQQQLSGYGQKQASVPYQASYANVFASGAGAVVPIPNTVNTDPIIQLGSNQGQARRSRAKLPPPSKIPSTAVEMPGDSLNNIGYLDVQFGALDFATEDSFENIPEKFNNAVTLENQQQQQHTQQQQQQQLSKSLVPGSVQDVVSATYDNQNKTSVAAQQQQSSLTSGIQNSHLDALAASYTQRTTQQQHHQQQHTQQMLNVGSTVGVGVGGNASTTAMQPGASALDQLTKSDHFSQASSSVAGAQSGYQSSYQNSVNAVNNKVTTNVFQPSVAAAAAVAAAQAVYGSAGYGNVQSSVANTYQPQSYGSYQPNSVNSYQHQQTQQHQQVAGGVQVSSNMTVSSGTVVGGTKATQNIPSVVGGVGTNSSGNNTANNVIANASYLSAAYGPQPSTYQTNSSVYGSSGLSSNTGYSVNTSNTTSQYASFNASAKVKENASNVAATVNSTHYDSVTGGVNSNTSVSVASSANSGSAVTNSNKPNNSSITVQNTSTKLANINTSVANVAIGSGAGSSGGIGSGVALSGSSQNNRNNTSNMSNNVKPGNSTITNTTGGNTGNSASTVGSTGTSSVMVAAVSAVTTASSSTSANKTSSGSNSNSTTGGGGVGGVAGATAAAAAAAAAAGASGIQPNIQMVSQYIQTSLPYYQQPVYSYEDLQMMQQRVPHVPGYYDLNYTPTSLGAGRDNLGSVAYSTMTDGRFARTDNNSSPVSNVSSTLSQQASSSGPMLNVPYAYFYGGNVMPGSFQYGTPAIYPQIQAANTGSGGQFPKPSYSTGYGSTNYDALTQATPDYGKGTYAASVNQQSKTQNVVNPPQSATSSDITSSMYGKGHVALNKVNSYEKQSFHSGTPPPFNMPNTQTAGGTSGQPYGMYLPTMPAGGHHMIHPPMHQMDGRLHNSSRRDSNSAGQRQTTNSQTKSTAKQGYSPSYWTGQN